jgi:hypothetical protein
MEGKMTSSRSCIAVFLCLCIISLAENLSAQESAPAYKLIIVENAATVKRVKGGRVSSQAVVRVTDRNDRPVAGVAVTFALPQFPGGASFANGALTSVTTTTAAGQASSGAFTAPAGSSFSVSVTASVAGTALTGAIPVTATSAAVAGAGGVGGGVLGLSTTAIVVIGTAAVVTGVVLGVTLPGGGKGGPQGTIAATGFTIGHP